MSFSTFPNNPFPPSTAQFDEGKNDFIQAEIDAIKDGTNIDSFGDVETALASKANTADVNAALATKTNLSNIAPAFDATSGVYAVGDKVINGGVLYEFTSAHSTASEWDESEVQPVKVSELIDSLKSGLTNIGTTLIGSHNIDRISVDTATATDLGSVALTAGKWLLIATIDWASNGTGYRQIAFGSGLNPARNGATTTAALTDTGKETYQQISRVYEVATTETVTLYGYQTSGAALEAMPYIKAIKISA